MVLAIIFSSHSKCKNGPPNYLTLPRTKILYLTQNKTFYMLQSTIYDYR